MRAVGTRGTPTPGKPLSESSAVGAPRLPMADKPAQGVQ